MDLDIKQLQFMVPVACGGLCTFILDHGTRSFVCCLLLRGTFDRNQRNLLAIDKTTNGSIYKHATSLTPCGLLLSSRLQPNTSPLFDDVDVLKQAHAMTSTLGEPQLRPLLLVRALELGGVFKRDMDGKTTSNEELEEELCGQSLSQYSFTRTHSF